MPATGEKGIGMELPRWQVPQVTVLSAGVASGSFTCERYLELISFVITIMVRAMPLSGLASEAKFGLFVCGSRVWQNWHSTPRALVKPRMSRRQVGDGNVFGKHLQIGGLRHGLALSGWVGDCPGAGVASCAAAVSATSEVQKNRAAAVKAAAKLRGTW